METSSAVVAVAVAVITAVPASIGAWAALRHRMEAHYVRHAFEHEFKALRELVHRHVNDHKSHHTREWGWLYEKPRGKHAATVERN